MFWLQAIITIQKMPAFQEKKCFAYLHSYIITLNVRTYEFCTIVIDLMTYSRSPSSQAKLTTRRLTKQLTAGNNTTHLRTSGDVGRLLDLLVPEFEFPMAAAPAKLACIGTPDGTLSTGRVRAHPNNEKLHLSGRRRPFPRPFASQWPSAVMLRVHGLQQRSGRGD